MTLSVRKLPKAVLGIILRCSDVRPDDNLEISWYRIINGKHTLYLSINKGVYYKGTNRVVPLFCVVSTLGIKRNKFASYRFNDSTQDYDITSICDSLSSAKDTFTHQKSNELEDWVLTQLKGNFSIKWLSGYSKTNFTVIVCCETCGRIDKFGQSTFTNDCAQWNNRHGCCCRKTFISRKQMGEIKPETRQVVNQTTGAKYTILNLYEARCEKGHIFKTIETGAKNNLHCKICDIVSKHELFKLLYKLQANHIIKETFKDRFGSGAQKLINRLVIFTYNDKGHLTGKIVFNDNHGEQQALAHANKLVFRWFETQYLDNVDYCKQFLYDYYQEIVKKFGVRGYDGTK